MKRITAFLLIAGLCLTQACNNANKTKNTTDSAGQTSSTDTTTMSNRTDTTTTASSGGVTSTAPLGKDDSEFAAKAATGGMMEVELGQIAQGKATNQRVKDFGSMMVQDHSAANDELKKLASAKNVTLPTNLTDKQRKEVDDLNKKNGADFDKAYMKMMVNDHEKDVKEFQKAGDNAKDPDLKNFVMKTLPTLQKHLDSAKAISGSK